MYYLSDPPPRGFRGQLSRLGQSPPELPAWRKVRFALSGPTFRRSHFQTWLGSPLWMPLMATAVLTVLISRADTRAHRRAAGQCIACGYDLAGVPRAEGGGDATCPECGTMSRGVP